MAEHVHEWRVDGGGAYCAHPVCDTSLTNEQADAILNEHETLKKATEALSAEDAGWCSGVLMDATNNCGVRQMFNRNPYYLTDALKAYADILDG